MDSPFEHFAACSWLKQIPTLPEDVAVGWSGGADSTALLLALKAAGYRVRAWHVDHGWRDSSAAEARALAGQAEAWGIPFSFARPAVAAGSNREAAARQARYAQFQRWAEEQGIGVLCLAHQRDDQAETVCMRLLQGAGPGGCRGMRVERHMGRLRIVRPFLHLSGKELREGLRQAGVAWLEDPSNRDVRLWRNRIRHHLFPAMEKAGVQPDELFLRWQAAAERLTAQLDAEADMVIGEADMKLSGNAETATKDISLPWKAWQECVPAVRARLLQKMMARLLGESVTPGRRHILLVEQWTNHRGRGGLDLSRCRLQRRRKRLHLQAVQADLVV